MKLMNSEFWTKLHYLVSNQNFSQFALRILNGYKLEVKLTLSARPYCSIKIRQIARPYCSINSM